MLQTALLQVVWRLRKLTLFIFLVKIISNKTILMRNPIKCFSCETIACLLIKILLLSIG